MHPCRHCGRDQDDVPPWPSPPPAAIRVANPRRATSFTVTLQRGVICFGSRSSCARVLRWNRYRGCGGGEIKRHPLVGGGMAQTGNQVSDLHTGQLAALRRFGAPLGNLDLKSSHWF